MTLEQYIKLNLDSIERLGSDLSVGQVKIWIDAYNIAMASTTPHKEQLTIQDNPVLTGLPSVHNELPLSFKIASPTPHKCPVCLGMGHVGVAMISVEQLNHTTLSAHTTEPCKACKEGIIWK